MPTRLMSPLRTLKNCGNSSSDQSRIRFPIPFLMVPSGSFFAPIILGSKSSLNIMPSCIRFSVISSALCSSASMYMLRNLYILNFFPFLPTRICEKNIGPGDFMNIIGPIITVSKSVNTEPTSPPAISVALLINACLKVR